MSPRKSAMFSLQNVENVVKPPHKPVVSSSVAKVSACSESVEQADEQTTYDVHSESVIRERTVCTVLHKLRDGVAQCRTDAAAKSYN